MTSYPFLNMAAVTAKYYFRFCISWCHCLQNVKVYKQTKFRWDISIGGWDITNSGFEIQTSGFDLDQFTVICILLCNRLPNFVQIGAPTAEIWRHIHFWIWWPRPLNNTSGFVFFSCHCLQKVKIYQQTKFCPDTSIGGWDITTFGFEIQTSAILEYYFRFRYRPVRRNQHVFLHQTTEFRPNQSTHRWNMSTYPFLNMAAATAKYYFRFRICWCRCLQKVKIYQQTKFRRDISIGGWDITTSGFEIQTSAIWEFYFRFRSWPFRSNRRVILHPAANFRPNRNIRRLNMTSIWRKYDEVVSGSGYGGCVFFYVLENFV